MNHNIDGLTPRETGMAHLASGSIAIVELNGDVSDIMPEDDFYMWRAEALAEDRRIG